MKNILVNNQYNMVFLQYNLLHLFGLYQIKLHQLTISFRIVINVC
jgi:hypothetical protein